MPEARRQRAGGGQASLLQVLTWRGSIHPSPVLAAPRRSLGCSQRSSPLLRAATDLQGCFPAGVIAGQGRGAFGTTPKTSRCLFIYFLLSLLLAGLLNLEKLLRQFLISKDTLSVRMLDDSRDPTPLLKEIRDDKTATIIVHANASMSHTILQKVGAHQASRLSVLLLPASQRQRAMHERARAGVT